MIRLLFISAAWALFSSQAFAATISIDWANNQGSGGPTPVMGATEVAGVVPVSNWNSFPTTGSGGPQSNLINDLGANSGASVSWTANNTWSTPITDTPGDNRMMRGYLDTTNTSTTSITVSSIPYALYDVYVYADGDNVAASRGGRYTIGATSLINIDPASTNFSGSYISGANYVRFTNVSGASFNLTGTPTSPGNIRAPINGIQITAVPEPSSIALLAFGSLLMWIVKGRRG